MAFVLAFLEAVAFAGLWLHPDLTGRYDDFSDRTDFADYPDFIELHFDAATGWRTRPGTEAQTKNCVGEEVAYAYDAHGARRGGLEGEPRILVVGGSYSHGDEVQGDESFPARLAERLGVPVANYGVGGFGPLQASLRFEEKLALHPGVRIAILGVMHENINRAFNSYRPVYVWTTGASFGFKPFVRLDGAQAVLAGNPNDPPAEGTRDLSGRIRRAFEEDFWSSPERRFPYTVTFGRVLASRRFALTVRERVAAARGLPEFWTQYHDPAMQQGLTLVLERFVDAARSRDVVPIVAFLPMHPTDRESPDDLRDRLAARFEGSAHVLAFGREEIDWARYNLKPGACHPSRYGYDAIASFLAGYIETQVGRPADAGSAARPARPEAATGSRLAKGRQLARPGI